MTAMWAASPSEVLYRAASKAAGRAAAWPCGGCR